MNLQKTPWPHSPPHRTLEPGTYMVTGATYQKQRYFADACNVEFLHNTLLELAANYGWKLQAWAVFANHYHFLAQSPLSSENLSTLISHLHVITAKYINAKDHLPNRRVWYQFWDSHITYQYSYLSRLNYIIQNPVHHGLVNVAEQYPWCSAAWFANTAPMSFYKTVRGFKIDKVNVIDDF